MMVDSNTILTFSQLGIMGRLGNSMFQISSVLGIAEKYGCRAVFPKWEYSQYFKNKIDESLDVNSITHIYHEPYFHYNEINEQDIVEIKPGAQQKVVDLRGYFQSRKYWEHCEDKILSLFEFNDEIKQNCYTSLQPGKNQKEVEEELLHYSSVHFRFGDYINNPFYADLIGTDYYKNAVKYIRDKCSASLVFSDDILKAEEYLSKEKFDLFFRNMTSENDIYDLCAMSLCKNNIIANSSYSWWGAYLRKDKNKVIIAPRNWFAGGGLANDTKDLYLPEMILL